MSTEENDNFYILEDEEKERDTSPLNYAAYEDDESLSEEEEETHSLKDKSAFGTLLRIMFSPIEGWKQLRRSGMKIETFQSGCFYPLLAILALCKFADFFYSVNATLNQVITQGVITFVAFFFGYFCVQMILSWFLNKEEASKFEDTFGKEYILVSLSTLALFSIFIELLPMIWPILIFLPIWTLYLMYKGIRFFKFSAKEEIKVYILSAATVIAVPFLIEWGLTSILPY